LKCREWGHVKKECVEKEEASVNVANIYVTLRQ